MTFAVAELGGGRLRFSVRVQPRARREAIVGAHGGALRVQLTAPPMDGRANEELVAFLARRLGIPRSAVSLLAGRRSRNKIVEVAGVSRSAVDALVAETEA